MKDKEEIVVVTKRCVDMAAYCDDIDKVPCADCGEMTWISSSWRGKKVDRVVCMNCFESSEKYKGDDCSGNVTEKCLSDVIEWVKKHHYPERTDKEIGEEIIRVMEGVMGKKINIIK